MIINDIKDLNAAPANIRERFMESLAAGINRWEWQNGEWVLTQDDSTIAKFGFATTAFPNAPVPEG